MIDFQMKYQLVRFLKLIFYSTLSDIISGEVPPSVTLVLSLAILWSMICGA